MIEIALCLVANVLVCGALLFAVRGREKSSPIIGSAVSPNSMMGLGRVAAVGAFLFLAGVCFRGDTFFGRSAIGPSAWMFIGCFFGGLACVGGERMERWITSFHDATRSEREQPITTLRLNTAGLLSASLIVTLVLTVFVALGTAMVGGFRNPELAASSVPLAAIGFCIGISVAGPVLLPPGSRPASIMAETAFESVAGMIVAGAMWEKNAELFRKGPIVATALGFVLLPVVLRPLFALATAAGALFAKVGTNETIATAYSRGAHVTASLVVIVLFGTTLSALGHAWLPFFFCGAAGVFTTIALLYFARSSKTPETSWLGVLGVTTVVASLALYIASRTGLAHSAAFGLVLCAAGAQGSALFARVHVNQDDVDAKRDLLPIMGARALGTLAVAAAMLDAISSAACSRWIHASLSPTSDWASALSHCDDARVFGSIDISQPVVLAAALLGVFLALRTTIEKNRTLVQVIAAILVLTFLGRTADASSACLAAIAVAAIVTSAALPSRSSRESALFIAGICAGLAPIAA